MTDLTADAIGKIVELTQAVSPTVDLPDGRTVVFVPHNASAKEYQPVDPAVPRTIRQQVDVDTAASFIAYFNDFKREESRIFASQREQNVVGVLDYHALGGPGAVGTMAHRVSWGMERSESWTMWIGMEANGYVSQGRFAEFIEEQTDDIVQPPGAELLELVSTLFIKKDVSFQSGIRLSDGTMQFSYIEDATTTAGKGKIDVPTEITLGIPVYHGGGVYKVTAYLRHRLQDGKLLFAIKLKNRQAIEDAAFEEAIADIHGETEVKPYRGALAD